MSSIPKIKKAKADSVLHLYSTDYVHIKNVLAERKSRDARDKWVGGMLEEVYGAVKDIKTTSQRVQKIALLRDVIEELSK